MDMKGKILITDTLFIADEHEEQIRAAGYEIERLPKANATEEELISALQGKVGYVLGGIEKVTDKVIESATDLKVIAFTGADWQAIIPGWEKAKERGVKISNAPGANAPAVAEFAFGMTLLMQRNMLELGRVGDKSFETTNTLQNAEVGVIGAGNIGSRIVKMVAAFAPAKIRYHSRSPKPDLDAEHAEHADLQTLLSKSDVVIVAAPGSIGTIFNDSALKSMKNNALIVSISPRNLIDFDALLPFLEEGHLRVAVDWPAPSEKFSKLPFHSWYNTTNHTAYNTKSVIQLCSDMGTKSLLNLLEKGKDDFQVV